MTLRLKSLEEALEPFRASANRSIDNIREATRELISLEMETDEILDAMESKREYILEQLTDLDALIND